MEDVVIDVQDPSLDIGILQNLCCIDVSCFFLWLVRIYINIYTYLLYYDSLICILIYVELICI